MSTHLTLPQWDTHPLLPVRRQREFHCSTGFALLPWCPCEWELHSFFFFLIYRWFLAVDQLWYYISLHQIKIFYFIFAAYLTGLQTSTGNLHLSLHNIALSESSIQGAFFNQDCECVLYLLVCSVFIVILAAGINLCRGIWIWGNNKQTDCL